MFDASRSISGSHAKVIKDGKWLTNVTEIEAVVENDKQELNVLGDDWTRHKSGNKTGTGSMTGYKVTSEMIQQGFEKFELIYALEDPEAYGHERIRLMNVMADELPLANAVAGETIEEETPFTFEGYELLDPIEEN